MNKKILFYTLIASTSLIAMEQRVQKTHSPKPLTSIVANAYAKQVTDNLDEKNLDQKAKQLLEAYEHIGNDHGEYLTQALASRQAYPFFQELPQNTSLIAVCLPLQQCVTYNFARKVFSVFDHQNKSELISLNAGDHDNVKFLNNTYLSYLKHTPAVDCRECILHSFEDAQWNPLATIEAPASIIDVSLAPNNTLLALALTNNKVKFWHQGANKQWQPHTSEIALADFADQVEAVSYEKKPNRSHFEHPGRFFNFKRTNEIRYTDYCLAISSISFLPNSFSDQPLLLLGLTPYCHKHPNEGILTLWCYDNNQWQLQQILHDKHDWPIVNIQPSCDGTLFLTQSYSSRPFRSYTTCWGKNNDGTWHIIKRTRQHSPTKIAPSFNSLSDSFMYVFSYNIHSENDRFFKQFSLGQSTCKKTKKLAIGYVNNNPTFTYEYEWKRNTRPIFWLNNDEIVIENTVFHLTPSLNYLLCQYVLKNILTKKATTKHSFPNTPVAPTIQSSQENRFYARLHTLVHSKTFNTLSKEEQSCLIKHSMKSGKYYLKSRAGNRTSINASVQERFPILLTPYLYDTTYFAKTDKK